MISLPPFILTKLKEENQQTNDTYCSKTAFYTDYIQITLITRSHNLSEEVTVLLCRSTTFIIPHWSLEKAFTVNSYTALVAQQRFLILQHLLEGRLLLQALLLLKSGGGRCVGLACENSSIFCLGSLRFLVLCVVGTVSIVMLTWFWFFPLVGSHGSFLLVAVYVQAVMCRRFSQTSVGTMISIASADVFVDQGSIVLQPQFSVVADGRFDDIFTVIFFSGIAETCQVVILEDFRCCGSFGRVKLEHPHHQINGLFGGAFLEPLYKRTRLHNPDLLYHGLPILGIERLYLLLRRLTRKVDDLLDLVQSGTPRKDRLSYEYLSQDTSHTPDVCWFSI